ncbi:MAG: hypothetical protein WDN26_19285 [Chitinophagaceae bacterium]
MENSPLHTPPPPPMAPPPYFPPPSSPAVVTQVAPQEIYDFAAGLLITQKKQVDEVRNALMQKGLDAQGATVVITELQAAVAKQRKIQAKKDMMYGGGVCILGIVITAVTYSIASSGSGGGTYFVSWGAILFGAIQFFRGVINMAR